MIPEGYLNRLAQIESGNNPKAKNPKSSAKGKYQFIDSTAKAYGLEDPMDEAQSEKAVIKVTEDNYKRLNKELGREPSAGELYLAHQQGAAGALRLLKNPEQKAVDLLGQKKIELNAGTPEMTAADFATKWTSKFDDLSGSQSTDTLMGGRGDDTLLPEGFEIIDEQTPALPEGFEIIDEAAAPQAAPNMASAPKKTGIEKALIAAKGLPLSIGKGATFGLLDEIQAGVAALPIAAIKQISPGAAYDEALTIARRHQQDFQKQNPFISGVAEVAGGVGTGVLGAGIVPQLSKLAAARPLTTSAATGAVSGGLYGFGTGEGSGQERLRSAGIGGGAGLLAGPAGAYLAPKIANATRGLAQRAAGLLSKKAAPVTAQPISQMVQQADEAAALPAQQTFKSISSDERAMDKIVSAIKKDFPDNYEQVIKAWKESDLPLAELYGSNLTTLAKGAAQYPAGATPAQKYFDEAISGVSERLTKNVPGSVDEFYTTADDLLAAGQAKAAPLYEEAFNSGPITNDRISQFVNSPELKAGINRGLKIQRIESTAKGEVFNPTDYGITGFNEAGDPIMGSVPNMRLLDAGKRGLDAMIQDETDQVSGRVTEMGRALIQLKKAYVGELKKANKNYGAALNEAGDYLSVNQAMRDGLEFLKPSTDAELVAKKIAKMTPKEKEAYKVGVGKSIRSAIENKSEGANPYNSIIGSPEKKKRLMSIYSPDEYKQLERSLMAENKLFKMRNEVLGGSPTVSKAMAAAQIASGGADALMAIGSGGIKQAGISGVKSVIARAFDGLNDKTAEAVSRIIYETDPTKKLILLQKVAGDKALSATEKQVVKQVYFKAAEVMSPKTGGAVGAGLVVPVFLDQNRAAMEGRGPEVDLPEMP